MIVHTCFNNRSEHGYKSSILKSGICKYIRRDEPEKFKWCVMEMALFNEHPKGKPLISNLINRLKIVLMEELSFHETVISSYLYKLLEMYDADRSRYNLLYSFCDIVMLGKRNRLVSYMNSWWIDEEFEYEKTELDKVLHYKKEGDSDELLLVGENLIHFIETKDERIFGCYMKLCSKESKFKNEGLRCRRRDGAYLFFEIMEYYTCSSSDSDTLYKFALEQFQKTGLKERYAFGVWICLMTYKHEHLKTCPEGKPFELSSMAETERYMNEMTRLTMDDYVINDHHVNANYGLGHFAEHGAYVKDEYLDLIEDADTYKKWYIKRKKMMDKQKAKKQVKKEVKKVSKEVKKVVKTEEEEVLAKDIVESIDWHNFSEVKVLEDGVCGGKVCCISVVYEGKKFILKEMGQSMNYGLDYILVDACKGVFGLRHMNMVRIKSNQGQLKVDPTKKSYVNNVKVGPKDCTYCMMNYWTNIGDLGKNKDKLDSESVKQESLKIRLFDGLFRSSDNILRNILVNEEGELLSIDEGDIYGKRAKIFNKHDYTKKTSSKELVDTVLDDLLSNESDKLAVVQKNFELYGFSSTIYDEFETRLKGYRDIVSDELS